MYQHPKIQPTIDISVMRQTYYHEFIHAQPNRILPVGPDTQLDGPHNRDRFKKTTGKKQFVHLE